MTPGNGWFIERQADNPRQRGPREPIPEDGLHPQREERIPIRVSQPQEPQRGESSNDLLDNELQPFSQEQRDRFLVQTLFTVTQRNSQPLYLSDNLTTPYVSRSTLKQERPQRISERSLPSPPAFVPSPGFSQTAGHRQWQRRFPKPAFRDPLAEIPRINAINRSRPIRPKSEADPLRKTVVSLWRTRRDFSLPRRSISIR